MNTIVCCKQILDPEAPPDSFKIDPDKNQIIQPPKRTYVISPFDENAVEAALRIKDAHGGKVTVISAGDNLMRDVVKKPVSMGADELILLEDPVFAQGDSWSTAYALAMAIKKIGEYDLIFCGRQAADWDAGQIGLGIAELLDIPSVSLVKKVEIIDGKARVERVISDGYQVIELDIPALITVSNELGEPRYATLPGIAAASRKEPKIWKPNDIGVDESLIGTVGRKTQLLKLFQPVREEKCEFITADSPAESGIMLADRLREAKII